MVQEGLARGNSIAELEERSSERMSFRAKPRIKQTIQTDAEGKWP